MKIQKISGIWKAVGFVSLLALSSCSRGYGCPYDFSVTTNAIKLITSGFYTLINFI
jgi:hypothetical protein